MVQNSTVSRHVLITGATGFIGSHLMKYLCDLGWNVYGISRKNSKNKDIYKIDVTDYKTLNAFIQKFHITHCVHLAGESLVESGQKDPYKTYQTNITGALNILESARKNKLQRAIITSSSHVYGSQKSPCTELDIPLPSRPYETSKLATDIIAQSYAKTFDMEVFIPRFVNIYGPGDKNDSRLIPAVFKSLLQDVDPDIWGGSAVRDYLYIEDALSAFECLLTNNVPSDVEPIFNFGSGKHYAVKTVVNKMVDIAKSNVKIRFEDEIARENEIPRQYVDSTKAYSIFGWKAKTSLDTGLRKTYTWYSENYFKKMKNGGET